MDHVERSEAADGIWCSPIVAMDFSVEIVKGMTLNTCDQSNTVRLKQQFDSTLGNDLGIDSHCRFRVDWK
jgi:hypothetical protein